MRIFEVDPKIVKGPWKKDVSPQAGLNLHDLSGNPVKKPVDVSNLEPVPLYKAFGGREYGNILDAGFNFTEKPSEFSDVEAEINVRDLAKIQELIGRKLNSYQASEILSRNFPLSDAKFPNLKQDEETFIVWFPQSNNRYLVNRTGATKYIRMWARLVD